MKKLLLMLLALALAIGLIVVIGCSDDDDETPAGPTVGDPNDPEFMIASEMLGEDFIEHDFTILTLSILLTDYIPAPGKSGKKTPFRVTGITQVPDSLSYEYSYSDYWHIFAVYARFVEPQGETNDTLIYTGTDSLRFGNASGPMPYPDETTTAFDIRAHLDAAISTEGGYIEVASHASFDMAVAIFQPFVINGTSSDTVEAYFETVDTACVVAMTSNQTATNLTISPYGDECPTAGTLNVAATLDIDCLVGDPGTPLVFSSAWNVLFTFSGTTITITYTNGNTVWTVTAMCDGSASPANIVRNLSEHL
jgi:hypothetical protein